ncbi:hypothetical protein H257_01354 [Aphanomyces astaci]|uniref:Uncharacterized protein n=1 Tax=Aphanomyces astaci TaxID=112090 RepID=W4H8S6_APHAT|nr:hypothetical protein H257_01354 [Aphanomyces astaci]ETV87956.1 hypothetical protein H257_01354 [Aphanomyces astaci]|eukprot:XP_009822819.1 hypothetical protein H257_01354 [Aphanomyces astaci]
MESGVDAASPVSVTDAVQLDVGPQPELPVAYVEQFLADDACASIVDDLCNGIALQSEAKHMAVRMLSYTSADVVAQLYAAVTMVLIPRTDSFDRMAPPASSSEPPPASNNDSTSGFLRALGRVQTFVTRRRHSAQAYMAGTSIDGSVHLRQDELVPFLHSLPLFLTKREVAFISNQSTKTSNTELDVRLDVHDITKLVATAIKIAKKKAGASPFRPPVVFPSPEEPTATPHDVHAPKELKARPPGDSPDKDSTTHLTTQSSTFRFTHHTSTTSVPGDKRGTKYSMAATIQTTKLSMDDVDLHVMLDTSSPDKVDQASMSNIFSLGTPRQLSPRELARRRDILSYLDSIHAAAMHEDMLAKKKQALLERPVNVVEGDVLESPSSQHCLPSNHDSFLTIATAFDIRDPPHPHGQPKAHKSKPVGRKQTQENLVDLPKMAEDEASPQPIPDFHLPQIDTNRLEVGVKVVYPGKEKIGGKRNPSRNARLKLHNYNVKTPPHLPPGDFNPPLPAKPTDGGGVILPKLPVSPIKASQTQPAKPTVPAAPLLMLPKSIASPIKPPPYHDGEISQYAAGTSPQRVAISHARMRGKPPVRSRFKFSDSLFRPSQN